MTTSQTTKPSGMHADPHEQSLWDAYGMAPSQDGAQALVELYLPLVRGVLRSLSIYARPELDRDDLLQHALIGLWTAINRFDPARGSAFRAYAARHIRGAILDALRRHDRLSRTDRALLKTVEKHIADYAGTHDAVPDEQVLADLVGISRERLQDISMRSQAWVSIDAEGKDVQGDARGGLYDRLPDEHAVDPPVEAMRREQGARFRTAFKRLPPREQKILYLYYYEDLTLKEISVIFDLSEARICQIHASVLLLLKGMLVSV